MTILSRRTVLGRSAISTLPQCLFRPGALSFPEGYAKVEGMKRNLWQAGTPELTWGRHQTELSAYFLQSREWALFQAALGKQIFYASDKHWSWMAILEKNRLGSYLYAPHGPTASSPSSLKKAIEVMKQCATEQKADFIRIEPQAPNAKKTLKELRAKHAHRDIHPKHNLIKDLDRPYDELYNEMASTNRRLYRQAEKNGFTFESSYDLKYLTPFLDMTHEVASRTGIQPHRDEYFQTMTEVLLPLKAARFFAARHNGKLVSICIVFEDATTRYYAHAASAAAARKLQPSVPLVGHLIFNAQEEGKRSFDYNGVAPPGSPKTHKWAGFSQFKRSFGGREVEYSGTWEIPINHTRYLAYRLLGHARDAQRKLLR